MNVNVEQFLKNKAKKDYYEMPKTDCNKNSYGYKIRKF